jgi:hypothetical protein
LVRSKDQPKEGYSHNRHHFDDFVSSAMGSAATAFSFIGRSDQQPRPFSRNLNFIQFALIPKS